MDNERKIEVLKDTIQRQRNEIDSLKAKHRKQMREIQENVVKAEQALMELVLEARGV